MLREYASIPAELTDSSEIRHVLPITVTHTTRDGARDLRIAFHRAVSEGKKEIVFDASGCRFLTAATLGVLATAARIAPERGCRVALGGANDHVRRSVRAAHLDGFLEVLIELENAAGFGGASLERSRI